MDALILSCGTGGGHDSAARAIQAELSARGHRVEMLNPYTLKEGSMAAVVDYAYIRLVQKSPAAFGAVYYLGNLYRRLPIHSPVYLLNGSMVPYLERYLAENAFDAVIMTHLYPAEIMTKIKRKGSCVPKTVFIATDYACIPFTEETDCDYYIIPAKELTDDFVRRGIPKEKLYPLGIPVQAPFSTPQDKSAAKVSLGLDQNRKYIVVAGGSIGAGHVTQIIGLLLEHYSRDKVELIVICGNNHDLFEKASAAYGDRCTVLSHTTKMAEYLKACDLFISKPGGLSSTEAAVSGTALIHISPIPGCETLNMRFFDRYGMCVAVSSPKRQLTSACDMLMSETLKNSLKNNQQSTIHSTAAKDICDLLEEKCPKKAQIPSGSQHVYGQVYLRA